VNRNGDTAILALDLSLTQREERNLVPTDTVLQDFELLLGAVRPRLHRYCARMTGSFTDGEDVVQEALMKAYSARPAAGPLDNAEAWLLRIAHNVALDFLRQRSRLRQWVTEADDEVERVPAPDEPDPDIVATSLQRFMQLPALQRSAVILKDVLGHSVQEAAAITGTSDAALRSALQRGRARLRELAQEPDGTTEAPDISHSDRARLLAYVEGFNNGDFDAIRAMLAEDVRLDLVAKFKRRGRSEVSQYLGGYAAAAKRWAFAAAIIENRPAMLVYDRGVSLDTPAYFVALDIRDDKVVAVRDFLFGGYRMEGLGVKTL
jgi:RNA polymerase sigma-70 factor (ECF subfamily)